MFTLGDVRGWCQRVFCTQTAIAAAFNRTAKETDAVLRQVTGETEEFREDYNLGELAQGNSSSRRRLEDLTRQLESAKDHPYWQPTPQQASKSAAAWAMRDRIELYDLACLLAHQPLQSGFEEPQRSYHRRLKDAVGDGKLAVAQMRGTEPNTRTLVMRDDLRILAKACKDEELLVFLKKWDSLNPTKRKRKKSKL